MFNRKLAPIIADLLREFRIVYLTGPRQAGKTTLAKSLADTCGLEYITFDDQTMLASAKNDPLGFIDTFQQKKLILDEFQYLPELIPAIKQTSDGLATDVKGKFLLTGSADIFKSGKTQEALPGHMARLELYPLSLSERFNGQHNIIDLLCNQQLEASHYQKYTHQELAQFILAGGYPEVQNKSPRAKQIWYKSYIDGRLFKDFESLHASRGDYRSKLKALIPYLSGLSGNLIKYSNISNDIGQEDKLIKTYIEILELMFIIKLVPAYLKNKAKRQATTIPKLHMIDTGLACNLLGIKSESQLAHHACLGGLLESLIFMELLKQNTWSCEQVGFFHFRDKYKNEVDIVLERDNSQIIGIEIKASQTIKSQDFKGLIKLHAFNPAKFQYGIIFYAGQEVLPFSQGGIELYAAPISMIV